MVALGPWRLSIGGLRVSASDVDKPLVTIAVAGVIALALSRTIVAAARRQSIAGFYACAAVVMWMFALGPTVMFRGVPRAVPGLYRLLFLLPGGGGIRVPARFWIMATLCLAVVAGVGASHLLARRPRAVPWLTALLAIGLLSDGWSTIPVVPAPAGFPDAAILRGRTVMALPIGNFADFAPQYLAVTGGWRSVNGYSGYEPKYYEAVRQGTRFEVDDVFDTFRARDDLFVVVNTDQPRLVSLVERQPGAVCVAERKGARQYRLPRRSRPAPSYAVGAPIRIARATASCPAPEAAFDGNLSTHWFCGPQFGNEWFVADLGVVADRVAAIRYTMGRWYGEFPRVLIIDTSVDGQAWEPASAGDVIGPMIEGALLDPLTAPTTVSFEPRRARYVRLRQTGRDNDVVWALPELAILTGP